MYLQTESILPPSSSRSSVSIPPWKLKILSFLSHLHGAFFIRASTLCLPWLSQAVLSVLQMRVECSELWIKMGSIALKRQYEVKVQHAWNGTFQLFSREHNKIIQANIFNGWVEQKMNCFEFKMLEWLTNILDKKGQIMWEKTKEERVGHFWVSLDNRMSTKMKTKIWKLVVREKRRAGRKSEPDEERDIYNYMERNKYR